MRIFGRVCSDDVAIFWVTSAVLTRFHSGADLLPRLWSLRASGCTLEYRSRTITNAYNTSMKTCDKFIIIKFDDFALLAALLMINTFCDDGGHW